MKFNILDRRIFIWLIFTIFLALLGFRLAQLTLVEGQSYANLALNTRLKSITSVAKRGDIYDRNGKLLAGNLTAYAVRYLYDQNFDEDQQRMTIELFKLLAKDGELTIDIPIESHEDGFVYASDIKKEKWLTDNGFAADATAQQVFDYYRDIEQIPETADKYSAQNILMIKGVYLPIRVKDMAFSYDYDRKTFLDFYNIDEQATAAQTITAIREKHKIDESFSDLEAYYIILLRYAIASKGYLKFEPIKIARNVSKETAILIQEQGMKFPNVSIEIEPVRYYPEKNLASHYLGYLGKISTAKELEKYNEETGYRSDDSIGKVGIEGVYESVLKGTNGKKWIETDAYGRYISDVGDTINDERFKDSESKAGDAIALTIDIDLQAQVRDYLIRTLEALRVGGVYESPYGNTVYKDAYKNADTGAVVVVDVRSGEVLSMVSYPDYDNSLFAEGITYEDYAALQPANPDNPLAPRPLFNIAANTAVQPGSTFKMVTAFAALEAGLDPYTRYRDAGYIATDDGRTFACWIWNLFHGAHGPLNLLEAIEVSCNYYFYSVGNGYDYARKVKLPFDVGTEKIIEAARLFGLGEATGIEIGETVAGLPDPNRKKNEVLFGLRSKLNKIAEDFFSIDIHSDPELLKEKIDLIVTLGDENPGISRGALIEFLQTNCQIEPLQKATKLADIVKYSYFTQMGWFEGDTFNLAIGQGQHSYTPIQMARYISTIANGGYLYDLTLVKEIGDEPVDREPYQFVDPNGYIQYLKEGMRRVVANSRGSANYYFRGFPMEVAAKTGTAEKENKIPTENEVNYILKYLQWIAPKIEESELEVATAQELKRRTDEIVALYQITANSDDEQAVADAQSQIDNLVAVGYLERAKAMRAALKNLVGKSLTDKAIDQFKEDYDNFTWFVSFAPYDQPEIAVVVLIPQGGSGGYAASIVKDIYGYYFDLAPTSAQ